MTELLEALKALIAQAETEGRDLTDEEAERAADLNNKIEAARKVAEIRSASDELLKPVRTDLHIFAGAAGNDEVEQRYDTALRSGNMMEIRAQSEGIGSAGGYLVPSTFRNKIVEKRLAFGGFQTVAETITTSKGEPMEWVTVDDTANLGVIVAEGGAIPTSGGADLVFGTKTLGAYKYGSGGASNLPLKVSWELLQDNAYDLKGKLSGFLGTRIARAQAPHWLTGTGVGQPEGLLTPKAVTGNIAANTGPSYAELVSHVHDLDPEYREGAVWVMNDATLEAIRKLVDGAQRPLLWNDNGSLGDGMAGLTLLGYKVVIDQAMPNFTTNGNKFLAFGRMSDAYVIRRVKGFELVVLNELYAPNGQVGFLGWERADGAVQDSNAYVVLGGKT